MKFLQTLMLMITFILSKNLLLRAADKTIDYTTGSGSDLASVTDGTNGVADVSLDLSGAVDFVIDAGSASPFTNYNDLRFNSIPGFWDAGVSTATSGITPGAINGYGFTFYENSGKNFTLEEINIFRTVNVNQAGDETVTINGYENGTLVATYSTTMPDGATVPGSVTYTRASDFNSDPDWQEIDLITVSFVEANNGDFLSLGINSIVVDDPLSALPVELTAFTAQLNGSGVELNWETATEVNNYGFEIERQLSENRTQNTEWENIGFVQGHGNSNSPKSYEFIDHDPPTGNVQYRLKQIDTDGTFTYYSAIAEVSNGITSVQENESDKGLPTVFNLSQNYPNPFNPSTTIKYSIPVVVLSPVEGQHVKLKIYNILGNEVATLVDDQKAPGNYEITFNANKLSSGLYFYKLTTGKFHQTKKMLLVK